MEKELFAEIIIPLAIRGRFTYHIPDNLIQKVKIGSRVIVGFGKRKLYSALVSNITDKDPGVGDLKEISDILETTPILNEIQIRFWNWLSEYYMCSPGEVMKAALPSGLCLESETVVSINPDFTGFRSLNEQSALLFNIIESRNKISINRLPAAIQNRSTIKLLNELIRQTCRYCWSDHFREIQPERRTVPHIVKKIFR